MASNPRLHFAFAAHWFAEIVAQLDPDALDHPGLGEWDLRALVGHTSRALITVDTYLDQPKDEIEVATSWDYYLKASSIIAADPEAVVERGRQAGQALGDDPIKTVADLVDRVLAKLGTQADPVIATIVGSMRLSDYLPTRTFELVVHGHDIATATATATQLTLPPLDPDTMAATLDLAGRIAIASGSGQTVLRALTGRGTLPDGFSVI